MIDGSSFIAWGRVLTLLQGAQAELQIQHPEPNKRFKVVSPTISDAGFHMPKFLDGALFHSSGTNATLQGEATEPAALNLVMFQGPCWFSCSIGRVEVRAVAVAALGA
jgi:hypothetical protein